MFESVQLHQYPVGREREKIKVVVCLKLAAKIRGSLSVRPCGELNVTVMLDLSLSSKVQQAESHSAS